MTERDVADAEPMEEVDVLFASEGAAAWIYGLAPNAVAMKNEGPAPIVVELDDCVLTRGRVVDASSSEPCEATLTRVLGETSGGRRKTTGLESHCDASGQFELEFFLPLERLSM